jgi:hypothetical protein
VGLPARQRRVLDRIEDSLEGTDPRLATMFAIFGRLTRDEEMPRIEELRHRLAIMFLRIRLWMASRGRVRGRWPARVRGRVHAPAGGRVHVPARRRRPVAALLFPIALVMATATIVLVAKFGGTPRCSAAATAATAKPFPRGRLNPKAQKSQTARTCPAILNPLVTGR